MEKPDFDHWRSASAKASDASDARNRESCVCCVRQHHRVNVLRIAEEILCNRRSTAYLVSYGGTKKEEIVSLCIT